VTRRRHPPSIGTIVALNYVAQARVLHESIAEHDPTVRRVTLLIDGTDDDRSLPGLGDVLLPADLPIPPRELEQMMLIYSVMELATALKPALLRLLVTRSGRAALYLDPDIQVFSSLREIVADAEEHGIVLTPHTLEPIPRDGLRHSEQTIMLAGMYNLGFIAVSPSSLRFLDWWHERLVTDAVSDPAAGLFTDQRWIDWVPSLFPVVLSRNPGDNVAYWNLHHRRITAREDGWDVNGHPLRFFHFSGFEPATPWIVSRHMGDSPRPRSSRDDELSRILDQYAERLIAAGHGAASSVPYRLDALPNGVPLTPQRREFFRNLVIRGLLADAPLPFSESDAFVQWLNERGAEGFSRLGRLVWEMRPDLQHAFPDPGRVTTSGFGQWMHADAWYRMLADGLLPQSIEPPRAPVAPLTASTRLGAFGWNVIAYADAELGVGEVGRRVAHMVRATGAPMRLVSVPRRILSRDEHRSAISVETTLGYENSIVCVNADMVTQVTRDLGLMGTRGRRIGLWFWELDEFPDYLPHALEQVHEVWVTSSLTREALLRHTSKPVHLIKIPIEVPASSTPYTRAQLGMPSGPVLLTNFDYLSIPRRKNPLGVIRAYRDAVDPDEGVTLIVKSINAHHAPLAHDEIVHAARGRDDIHIVDAYITHDQMQAMIELADGYISLHRSEGFGLNVADALARQTPVVSTAYSGTLEFTSRETADLIPYTLVPVGPDCHPYPPDALWAEPDHDEAVRAIRRLLDEPHAARDRAARAARTITSEWSLAATARAIAPLVVPSPLDTAAAAAILEES
jgi:glycosyltransferase involved in cell wall biosynthesis